jgi:putative ABC transport system permease protein
MRHLRLSSFMLGLRALRRDWRSGELRLLMLALLVAVMAVTSVGFLTDRVGLALQRDSAQMLGGDLALRADQPAPANFLAQASDRDLAVAQTAQFPSMVSGQQGVQLASVKAVTNTYPLRGQLRLSEQPVGESELVAHAPAPGTVWVDPQLPGMLGLRVGDSLELGLSTFRVAKLLLHEPDRSMQFVNVAPRVMLNMSDLQATGLVVQGSRVNYHLLVAGEPAAVRSYQSWLNENLQRGQRLSTLESNRPEVQRTMNRANQFLGLVALLTVLIAAVAVALAARRFTLRHQDGVAVMRCLGIGRAQLTTMLWVEFLLLGLGISAVGIVIGFGLHYGLVSVVSAWIGNTLPAPSSLPVWHGLATGLMLLLGFALPPLSALRHVAPARVLRRDAGGAALRTWPAYILGLVAFFLLMVWVSGDSRLSLVVSGGFLAAFAFFAGVAWVLLAILGRWRRRMRGSPALRFALAGMSRRRGLTITQLCSLAIGLMILLLLAITRTDLVQGWQHTVPEDAPNTFLINIQPDQREHVVDALAEAGVDDLVMYPMIRGRLTEINQKPVSGQDFTNERAQRMVDREFNLSFAQVLPASNEVVQGRWLDPAKSEVSLEVELADTLGVKTGDHLTFDVAGASVQVLVSGLRQVKWDSFDANFFALMSPSALALAPTTYITSFHLPRDSVAVAGALVEQFPNLTVFDVGAILGQIQRVLDQVIGAVQFLFLFTAAAGIIVLGAALFSTRDERRNEAALLRALGASGVQLRQALRIELILLGILAGLLASGGAVLIASLLAGLVFDFSLTVAWWPWLIGIVAGVGASLLGGYVALSGVLKTPPLVLLREAV